MSWNRLLFTLDGRIGRAQWWSATIVLVLLQACIGFVGLLVLGVSSQPTFEALVGSSPFRLMALANLALSLAFGWLHFALDVKRLHDRDISAWPALAMAVLMLVGPVQNAAATFGFRFRGPFLPGDVFEDIGGAIVGVAGLAFAISMIVVLGFLRGWPGPNLYGPPPSATGAG